MRCRPDPTVPRWRFRSRCRDMSSPRRGSVASCARDLASSKDTSATSGPLHQLLHRREALPRGRRTRRPSASAAPLQRVRRRSPRRAAQLEVRRDAHRGRVRQQQQDVISGILTGERVARPERACCWLAAYNDRVFVPLGDAAARGGGHGRHAAGPDAGSRPGHRAADRRPRRSAASTTRS